jgi:hypothetical protein
MEFSERTTVLLVAFGKLATAPADAATTHVALAGASSWAQRLYADAGTLWAHTPDDAASIRWARDAALFKVAGTAREQRSARAWQRLSEGAST